MKLIKAGLIVFVFILAQSFVSDDSCLQWTKDYKLTWNDFKGSVPVDHNDVAVSKTKLNYTFNSVADTLNIDIESCFVKDKSWVVSTKETEYLLNHEQHHFDITEINARKFRQYASKWDGKINIAAYLASGCDSAVVQTNKMQDIYDKETNHSIRKTAQAKWNKTIDSLLNVYGAYENPVIKIPLKK